MPVIVKIDKNSPAEKYGLQVGEDLLSIDGHKITDVLDYKFYSYEPFLQLTLQSKEGAKRSLSLRKKEGQDMGLEFESYLMDKAKRCSNKCVFCFIDQMPKNMRESLYFKDDDARLSFLLGNYISLTNLSEADVSRMVEMRVSPVNISVQATNPDLRTLLLGNPLGGSSLEIMKTFAQNGITMNTQLVICSGLNDGDELDRSLADLKALYPAVGSISVVPAGLTKHRDGLYPLKPMTKEVARDTIARTEAFAKGCLAELGTSLAFCGDELYIKADLPLPKTDYYEDFTQLENGIGMAPLFMEGFYEALPDYISKEPKPFTIATGVAMAPFLQEMIDQLTKAWDNNVSREIYPIKNDFFGHGVTVAGLITGGDLIKQLKNKNVASPLLISANMLRNGGDVFLDDVTLKEIEEALSVQVLPVEINGEALLQAIYTGGKE